MLKVSFVEVAGVTDLAKLAEFAKVCNVAYALTVVFEITKSQKKVRKLRCSLVLFPYPNLD